MNKYADDRRKYSRFAVLRNVGEPVELQVIKDHKKIGIPGFILNLSSGGMRMVTLGEQSGELTIGAPFVLDLKLPHLHPFNIEGRIVSIQRGERARLHNSNHEWFLSLQFTKIKTADAKCLNQMAEDWNICETKIQMHLPDICYRQCACWDICEKNVKLKLS
jgi:hypothetical protein